MSLMMPSRLSATLLYLVLFSTLFAGIGIATGTCEEPLPEECTPDTNGKRSPLARRDALGLMFARTLSKRHCTTTEVCTTTGGGPTLSKTIDLQCGNLFGDNDYTGAVVYEIADCPATVAAGEKCLHVKVTVPAGVTLDPVKVDVATSEAGLPKNQGDGEFNLGICPNGECWKPLDDLMTLLSITTLCNQPLYFALHTGIGADTCTPSDPDGNNVGFGNGQSWFMAQFFTVTCPNPVTTCCCCPETETPTKFCEIGTGFAVPKTCPNDGTKCTLYTLNSKGCGRWGWYHVITGLPYKVDFYVGAGLNDLNKGTKVGTVEVKACTTDALKLCAFYVMDSGYRLNSAHVDVRCGNNGIVSKVTGKGGTQGYPCAPGQYNLFKLNGGDGTCPAPTGLGTSWESKPFSTVISCQQQFPISAIFHGTVSKSQPADTLPCTEGCGGGDTGDPNP